MSKWQPIETSKPDEPLLLWCADVMHDDKPKGVVMGYVLEHEDGTKEARGDGMHGPWNFIKWHPLPTPPEQEQV